MGTSNFSNDCCLVSAPKSAFQGKIEECLASPFFVTAWQVPNGGVVDKVVGALLATKKIRYGSAPTGQALDNIRNIVAHWVSQGQPIPLLAPFGSKKPVNGLGVDVAEVSAMKMFLLLRNLVTSVYSPGVHVRIRVEDFNPHFLFRREGLDAVAASKRYAAQLQRLHDILGLGSFSRIVHDTDYAASQQFVRLASTYTQRLLAYILESDRYGIANYQNLPTWKPLAAIGWNGAIPAEQRDYYRQTYARLYGANLQQQSRLMAEYMASSLARRNLGATGNHERWGSQFLYFNYCPPVPGMPASLGARVYWRTVPSDCSSTHVPPWRAKGALKLSSDRVVPTVLSWREAGLCKPSAVVLEDGRGTRMQVRADYVLM